MASLNLDDLFPIPPPQASAFFPERWPGVSASSTKALLDTVKDDYKKWHVFFNDKGFHKYHSSFVVDTRILMLGSHTTHHLFALWALGGDAGVIRAAYEHNADVQRPAFESPGPIDSTNWKEHLGQHECGPSLATLDPYAEEPSPGITRRTSSFSRRPYA
jgi:hypothetical protein